jgi:hypothetical protein
LACPTQPRGNFPLTRFRVRGVDWPLFFHDPDALAS